MRKISFPNIPCTSKFPYEASKRALDIGTEDEEPTAKKIKIHEALTNIVNDVKNINKSVLEKLQNLEEMYQELLANTVQQDANIVYKVIFPDLVSAKIECKYKCYRPSQKERAIFLKTNIPAEYKNNVPVIRGVLKKITTYWNKTRQYHARKTENILITLLHDGLINTNTEAAEICELIYKVYEDRQVGAALHKNEKSAVIEEVNNRLGKLDILAKRLLSTNKISYPEEDTEILKEREDTEILKEKEEDINNVEVDNEFEGELEDVKQNKEDYEEDL